MTDWTDVPLWDDEPDTPPWAETSEPQEGVVIPLGSSEMGALDLAGYLAEMRQAITTRIGAEYDALLRARPEGPLEVAAAPELRYLASTAQTLDQTARVLTEAARLARGMAGDVAMEMRPDAGDRVASDGGSMTVRTSARPDGTGETRVTVTQPTETWADTEQIIDVLDEALVDDGHREDAHALIDAVRALTSPWRWKTSMLDVYGRRLPDDLSARLRSAYGRRPTSSDPRVTIDTDGDD